jgi:hypothetical protein
LLEGNQRGGARQFRRLGPGSWHKRKREGAGWRAQAVWRNGDGYNVSFHPKGIRDFAADVGYSAIDIVAQVANCEPREAMRMLRDKLGLRDPGPVDLGFLKSSSGPYKEGLAEEAVETLADAALAEVFSEGVRRAAGMVAADVRNRHLIYAALTVSHKLPGERDAGVNCNAKRIGGWIYFEMTAAARRAETKPAGLGEGADVTDNAVDIPRPTLDPFDHRAAGGLLQATAEWIYETSFVPSRELSMLASIGIMAAFLSRRYVGPTGLSPNLYLVGLMDTGQGKDGPLSAAKSLLHSTGMRHLLGSGSISSDAAFEKLIRQRPAVLLPMDEIGAWLTEGSSRYAAQYIKNRTKSLLELYTSSKERGIYLGKDTAGTEELSSDKPIHMPCVSILGMSTPTTYFAGLTDGNAADGLIGRMTVMLIPPVAPQDPNWNQDTAIPDSLRDAYLDALSAWPVKGKLAQITNPLMAPTVYRVPFADNAAEEAYKATWKEQWALIAADPSLESSVGRAAEQTLKLAMIRAVSRDFATPAVTADDVEYGRAFAWGSARMMRDGRAAYLAGSEFEANCKAVLRVIKAAGAGGITGHDLRSRSGVSKLTPREFDEVCKHLTVMGLWRAVKSNRGSRYHPL